MKKYTYESVNRFIDIQEEIKNKINHFAENSGFATWGVGEVKNENTIPNLQEWVSLGCHADMQWFVKKLNIRNEILKWFPEVKSVLVFAYPYWHQCDNRLIAMYAHGYDYHITIHKKLKSLALLLSECIENFKFKISVDSSPVHEKTWAILAGIGWQGKNSLIINPKIGSWFLLGILATNICLPSNKIMENQCGNCNLCIKSCPTGAIHEKGYIDCRKCISYHTIENKKEIPQEIQKAMKNTIYGCDICQKVCPWNNNVTIFNNNDLCMLDKMNVNDIMLMDDISFRNYFGITPVKKSGINRIKRNAKIYLNNRE